MEATIWQWQQGWEPHHHHTTTVLQPFFQDHPACGWARARRELLDFMVQGKINRGRHTNHLAGRHFIRPPPPWKKFSDYLPVLTMRGFSLTESQTMYTLWELLISLYDSMTWLMRSKAWGKALKWVWSDGYVGWLWQNGRKSAEFLDLLRLDPVSSVIRKGRLRWFGYLEHEDAID